jgi:hypothetical protein
MIDMLRIASGAVVWAAHFTILYGITALACARAAAGVAPWGIALATAVGVAVASAIALRAYPRRDEFVHWITAAVAAIAVVAMLWEGVAGLVSRSCA